MSRRLLLAVASAALGSGLAASLGPAPAGASPAGPTAPASDPAPIPPGGGESYSLLTTGGALVAFGAAFGAGGPAKPASPAVAVAPTADGQGAVVVDADGTVIARGDARYHGDEAGSKFTEQVVGIATDSATGGYWLATSDGAVYAFDAPDYGSAIKLRLKQPIVGISPFPGGTGYRLVASDGGVFSYGSARYEGSAGALNLNSPIVGMATTSNGTGYWLVASDGGVFSYGNARFHGSTGSLKLAKPIVGIASTSDDRGYWLAASDGGVFTFGNAAFFGSGAKLSQDFVGIAFETGGYVDPLRDISHLTRQRIDQGVDYGGSGPIYAIGDGVVLNTTNAGWPGGAFITYELTDGRAKGDIIYVAENVKPMVKIGQEVSPGTVLGDLVNSYPNLETGWAAPPGNGESLARAAGEWSTYDDEHDIPTAYGENFSQLLGALGAPTGIAYAKAVGRIPAAWPTWQRG